MVHMTIKFPEKTFLSDKQNFNETIIKLPLRWKLHQLQIARLQIDISRICVSVVKLKLIQFKLSLFTCIINFNKFQSLLHLLGAC